MRLAIIGTRGIPNNYGGFEQISEFLSVGLAARGHEVSVYCSHNHPYQQLTWKGINLIHCYDPEYRLKTAGQFIYDLNCIRHARKAHFDVLLFMGYTSSSIWRRLFPKGSLIISNMDGLEWKRTKYSKPVQRFLKYAEKLAVRHSHYHIADSEVIKDDLAERYQINCFYIPYGAGKQLAANESYLELYDVQKNDYFMLMARMEPENNIDMILEGFANSGSSKTMVVVGNPENTYGRYLRHKYLATANIKFIGSIFDQQLIHSLRAFSSIYFHGHSVGGTNPSLLEAMASGALIAAHQNPFNQSILGGNGFYFSSSDDVSEIMTYIEKQKETLKIQSNLERIRTEFNWEKVIDQYDFLIRSSYKQFKL